MKHSIFILILLFVIFNSSFSLDYIEVNDRDLIKQEFIQVNNYNSDSIKLEFQLIISNTALFNLQNIVINNTYFNFFPYDNNDTILDIFFNEKINATNLSIRFEGNILASNDSLFTIDIKNIKLNNQPINDTSFNFKIKTQYNNLSYIRYSQLWNVYPNPLYSGNKIQCEYISDIDDDIKISMFDIKGREYIISEIKDNPKGKHTFEIPINNNFYNGFYYLVISDKFGPRWQKFELIR